MFQSPFRPRPFLRIKLQLVLIVPTVLFCSAAYGAVYYVDNSGSPACTNSPSYGSETQPWCTMQYGIGRMAGGDTLYVKNGTYSGDYTITGPSGSVLAHTVISAYPGHAPVISGPGLSSGRIKISHGCSYIDFTGFTITNHNQGLYLDDDAGTSTPCSNVTVSNITVHDVGQEGIAVRAGSATAPRNFVIKNSLVYNTGRLGSSQNGEGIYVGSSSGVDNTNGVTLLNNTIHDTQDECIELKGDSHDIIVDGNTLYNCLSPGSSYSSGGGAIELDEPRNSTANPNHIIRNNIIHDVAYNSGITKYGIRAGTGATIYNNVLYNIASQNTVIRSESANYPRVIYHNTIDAPSTQAYSNSGTTVDLRNNIGPTTLNNVATSAAYYVNQAARDYHLATGSAPINSGVDLRSVVPIDHDGIARDAKPDIGAYEFGGTATPPSAPQNLRVTSP